MNNSICYTTSTHYNARASTHLREMTLFKFPIFTAIISSMVLIADFIITNHHCPHTPSHATEEQWTVGEMG